MKQNKNILIVILNMSNYVNSLKMSKINNYFIVIITIILVNNK